MQLYLTIGGRILCVIIFIGHCSDQETYEIKGGVFEHVPASIQIDSHYLFYLHGRIIENEGRRPTHPQFGIYEYDQILQVLSDSGYVVISEARQPMTSVTDYSELIATEINHLLKAGVPPQNITTMGFSKGGIIAIALSSILQNPDLNFIFMASCGDYIFEYSQYVISGRILSIYEVSDDLGVSCGPLFERSPFSYPVKQIEIHTGKGHGAFYRPMDEWITPVSLWLSNR